MPTIILKAGIGTGTGSSFGLVGIHSSIKFCVIAYKELSIVNSCISKPEIVHYDSSLDTRHPHYQGSLTTRS